MLLQNRKIGTTINLEIWKANKRRICWVPRVSPQLRDLGDCSDC